MKLLFFDLETTGTNPGRNGIHQISGSICIAAHDMGFEMLGIELDPDYYVAARERLKYRQSQLTFNFE